MDFKLTTPELAQDCWPGTPQPFVNEIFEKTRGMLEDLTGSIASASTPDPDDRDKLWIKLDGSGNPIGLFYWGNGEGAWIWPYEGDSRKLIPGYRMLWVGDPADIPTLGGGSTGAVTLSSGPFWEIDTGFSGRSPMGVGSIPDANPAVAISSEEDYGEAAHTQGEDEVGPHTHVISSQASITHDGVVDVVNSGGGSDDGLFIGQTGDLTNALTVGENNYTTSDGQTAMPIIHPVRGIYFLKRTIRIWLTG